MRDPGEEKPRNWFSRLVYAITRQRFGKVLLPLKIHGHSPSRLAGMAMMTAIGQKTHVISQRTAMLAQVRVGALVECGF